MPTCYGRMMRHEKETSMTEAKIRLSKPGECIACPVEVRDLAASAHNLLSAFDMAQVSQNDWHGVVKEMCRLRDSLARFQPFADAHFADPRHSRPTNFYQEDHQCNPTNNA